VNRENAFDADAVRGLSDHERFFDAASTSSDADAFENLNALFLSFSNQEVNPKTLNGRSILSKFRTSSSLQIPTF